ncbi:unnamed protein product [Nippostrongylus brasiliensis]|uniref:Fork-head domain-containing protein n=1 Tax=Nippostrongylus brasiliensis TaxID=27835 RepID=A0A0N4YPK1_NIPBR|nr:unnamed protein product [Nippostrongylus brasiliensis]
MALTFVRLATELVAPLGGTVSGLYDSAENLNGRLGATSVASTGGLLHSPDGNTTFSPSSCNMSSPAMNDQMAQAGGDMGDGVGGGASGVSKKSTTRRNAWGNLSYADLITQAIMQSPEKRLTLSQVYEWMVQNVPYFRDKGDSNSSAGWKISRDIRPVPCCIRAELIENDKDKD